MLVTLLVVNLLLPYPVQVLNEHLSLLFGRYVAKKGVTVREPPIRDLGKVSEWCDLRNDCRRRGLIGVPYGYYNSNPF